MKKLLLFLSFALVATLNVLAQKSIHGKVTSKTDGTTVIGASVIVKRSVENVQSPKGAVTDIDGNYSLTLEDGEDTLVFTYLSFKTQTVPVNGRDEINIVLEPDAKILEEIVVVGYGSQKKSDLTGSVGSVRGADVTKIPSISPEQALQGKIAGVQVSSTSGQPGSAPVVRIRGVGTLNDASPIYVVDGVILDNIAFLSSSDIESFEVLKDASATAIYGARGANGVIIVTTKTGKVTADGKASVDVSAEYSVQHIAKKIPLLTGREFAEVVNAINPGTYNNLDAVPNTDWQDEVFNDYAPMQNFHVGFSGATDKYSYYLGAGLFNQEGVIPNSTYSRVSVKLNNTYNITKNFRLGAMLTVTPSKSDNPADVVATLYRAWPVSKPYNEDGSFAVVDGGGNPLASIFYDHDQTTRLRSVGSVFAELKILKDFTFKSTYGFDLAKTDDKSFTPVFFVSPSQSTSQSSLTIKETHDKNWLVENLLTYNKTMGKHFINALAGVTAEEQKTNVIGGTVKNLIGDDPSLWYLTTGDQTTLSIENPGDETSRIASYLFRVNYTYGGRYLLTASLRHDGSSKFGATKRYGDFPSVALGWNIANEKFMATSKVSTLKVRGSWGIIGNDKIDYKKQYSLVNNSVSPVFNETLNTGSSYDVTGNPDLKWEETTQTDIGLEAGILNNKLRAEFDYYNKVTDGILVDLQIPGHLGNGPFAKVTYNAAKVQNSGFELTLNWTDDIGKVNYSVGANGATVHNEVKELGATTGINSFIVSGSLNNGQNITRTEVGRSIGEYYGYNVIGVFQNQADVDGSATLGSQVPGDLKFEDINGDGLIDDKDRTYLGSYIPKFIYGFNINVSYSKLSLALDFSGQYGNKIYNGKAAVRPDLYNFEENVKDYWRGDGTSNTEPRPTTGGVNYEGSSYFVHDASFFRLRNIMLSYDLSSKFTKRIKIMQTSVFLRATNLFTISSYSGYTPEISSTDALSSGVDLGSYPVTAIYSLGLNFNF